MSDIKTLSTFSPVIYLHVVPRITGVTSMISSFVIIYLIFRSARRLSTVYHRIMFGMSVSNIMGSFALALAFLPMPKEMPFEEELGISFPGARYGNTFTCNLQGFFVFFGATCSHGYSQMLCVYYACAIFFRMKEESIHKYVQPFLLLCPIIVGILVAVPPLLLDLYNPPILLEGPWCSISSYPNSCDDNCIRGSYLDYFSQAKRIVLLWIFGFVIIAIAQVLVIISSCFHPRLLLQEIDIDENNRDKDEFDSPNGDTDANGGHFSALSLETPSFGVSNAISSTDVELNDLSPTRGKFYTVNLEEQLDKRTLKREANSSSFQSSDINNPGKCDSSEQNSSVIPNPTFSEHPFAQQIKKEPPRLNDTESSLQRGDVNDNRNNAQVEPNPPIVLSDEGVEKNMGQDEGSKVSDDDSAVDDTGFRVNTNPISLALQALAYVSVFGLSFSVYLSFYIIDKELWLKLWLFIFPLHGFFHLIIFLFHKVYNYRKLHSDESVGEVINLLFRSKDVQEPCFVERISIVRDYHSSLAGNTAVRLSNELGDRILIRRSALVDQRNIVNSHRPEINPTFSSESDGNPRTSGPVDHSMDSTGNPFVTSHEFASKSDSVPRTSGLVDQSMASSSSNRYDVSNRHDEPKSSPAGDSNASNSRFQLSGFSSVLDAISW